MANPAQSENFPLVHVQGAWSTGAIGQEAGSLSVSSAYWTMDDATNSIMDATTLLGPIPPVVTQIPALWATGVLHPTWDSSTTYAIGDVVQKLGVFYVALAVTTNEDPPATPTVWGVITPDWGDISHLVTGMDFSQGSQYEVSGPEAGNAKVVCVDVQEQLQPSNPTSPFNTSPNALVPYRPLAIHAIWPNPEAPSFTGPANIINDVNQWHDVTPLDTTTSNFETTLGQWEVQNNPPLWDSGKTYPVGVVVKSGALHYVSIAESTGQDPATSPTFWTLTTRAFFLTRVTTPTRSGGGAMSQTSLIPTGSAATLLVPTVPGETFTASIYTNNPSINGALQTSLTVVNGQGQELGVDTTTTLDAWVRLEVTFVATSWASQLQIAGAFTTTSSAVYWDDVQLEYGATAGVYTDTEGLGMYPQFFGYVERYPTRWESDGFQGWTDLEAVDAISMSSRTFLFDGIQSQIISDLQNYYPNPVQGNKAMPSFYWPLDDGVSPEQMVTLRQQGQPVSQSAYAPTNTVLSGQAPLSLLTLGVPGANTTVSTNTASPMLDSVNTSSWSSTGSGNNVGYYMHTDIATDTWVCAGDTTPTTPTIGAIVAFNAPDNMIVWHAADLARNAYIQFRLNARHPQINWSDGVNTGTAQYAVNMDDGFYRLWTVVMPTGVGVPRLYLNGGEVPLTVPVPTPLNYAGFSPTSFDIGQSPRANIIGAQEPPMDGAISNVWIGPEIDSLEVFKCMADLVEESTPARIARLGGYGFQFGRAIALRSPDAGSESVAIGTLQGLDKKPLTTALYEIADTNVGQMYADRSGGIRIVSNVELLTEQQRASFGEDVQGGEIPYLGDIKYSLDPQFIYNVATATQRPSLYGFTQASVWQPGPTPKIGGAGAKVTGTSVESLSNYMENDLVTEIIPADASQCNTWVTEKLLRFSQPINRLESLKVEALSHPAALPTALGLGLWTKVDVTRRMANNVTITGPQLITKASVSVQWGASGGQWLVDYQMSDFSMLTPDPGSIRWHMGITTESIMGVSTILG